MSYITEHIPSLYYYPVKTTLNIEVLLTFVLHALVSPQRMKVSENKWESVH